MTWKVLIQPLRKNKTKNVSYFSVSFIYIVSKMIFSKNTQWMHSLLEKDVIKILQKLNYLSLSISNQ